MIINYQEKHFDGVADVVRETLSLIENIVDREKDDYFDFDVIIKNKRFNTLKNSLQESESVNSQAALAVFKFLQILASKLPTIDNKEFLEIIKNLRTICLDSCNYLLDSGAILDIFTMTLDKFSDKEQILDLFTITEDHDLPKIDTYSSDSFIKSNFDVTSNKISGARIIQEFIRELTPPKNVLEEKIQSKIKKYENGRQLSDIDENSTRKQIYEEVKEDTQKEILALLDLRYHKYPAIREKIYYELGGIRNSGLIIEMLLMFVKDISSPSKLRGLILDQKHLPKVLAVCVDLLKEIHHYDQNVGKEVVENFDRFIQKIEQMKLSLLGKTRKFESQTQEFFEERNNFLKEVLGFDLSKINYRNASNYEKEIYDFREFLSDYQGDVQANFFNKFVNTLRDEGISDQYFKIFNMVRVKSSESIIKKLNAKGDGFDLSQMVDIIGCRLVVEDLDEVHKVVELLERYFGDVIIEKENKYLENSQKIPYRAIHYLIRIDDNLCFELQIKTFRDVVIGELEHYFVKELRYFCKYLLKQKFEEGEKSKKELLKQKEIKKLLTHIYWTLQYILLEEYKQSIKRR